MTLIRPAGFSTSSAMLRLRASVGTRSERGCSTQSTSPLWSAAAAVAGSGRMCHSTRGKCATLPPEAQSGGSCRGM